MKIRTDFVTNSSSSSFICITVVKKDGEKLEGRYSNDDGFVYGSRRFAGSSEKFAEKMKSGADMVNAARKWFSAGLPLSSDEDPDDYAGGDLDAIRDTSTDDIDFMSVTWGCRGDEENFQKDCLFSFDNDEDPDDTIYLRDVMKEALQSGRPVKEIYEEHIAEYPWLSHMKSVTGLIDYEVIPEIRDKYITWQAFQADPDSIYGSDYVDMEEEIKSRGGYHRNGALKKADYYVLWNDKDEDVVRKMVKYKQEGAPIVFITMPQLWKAFKKTRKLTREEQVGLFMARQRQIQLADEEKRAEKQRKEEEKRAAKEARAAAAAEKKKQK